MWEKIWEEVKGVITPGGTPLYRCPICGCGEHLHGVEFPDKYHYCPECNEKLVYPFEIGVRNRYEQK